MRVSTKITGKVGAVITKVELGRFGRDNAATMQFAGSLANSIARATKLTEIQEVEKGLLDDKKIQQTQKRMEDGEFALVNVDVWVEIRKGREVYFARVWIDERNAGVRTLNCLSGMARHIWGWTLQLKTCIPPKGMEGLRGINVLKGFEDLEQEAHKCHIVDGKVVVEGDDKEHSGITQIKWTTGMEAKRP